MKIHIDIDDDATNGKVADAALVFEPCDGVMDGLKLIGFGIWERRGSDRGLNVTMPARQYTINGERRSFALLRPETEKNMMQGLRDAIVAAYRATVDDENKIESLTAGEIATGTE